MNEVPLFLAIPPTVFFFVVSTEAMWKLWTGGCGDGSPWLRRFRRSSFPGRLSGRF
jgi:hypothetical protein